MPLSDVTKTKLPALRDILKATHTIPIKFNEINKPNDYHCNPVLNEKLIKKNEEEQQEKEDNISSSQISLIDNILDLASKLDNNNNNNKRNKKFIYEIKDCLPPPPALPVESFQELLKTHKAKSLNNANDRSKGTNQSDKINRQLTDKKITPSRPLKKENDTNDYKEKTKSNNSEVEMRKPQTKFANNFAGSLFSKQTHTNDINEKKSRKKEIETSSSKSSSCSSTILLNHLENKIENENLANMNMIMRQSVDLESYTSQLPLSSSYWNYDEINELRTRFISLLSSDLTDNKSEEKTVNEFFYNCLDI